MIYAETKVYFDGSHYIGIPHTERPGQKRKPILEEEVEVIETSDRVSEQKTESPSNDEVVALEWEEAEVTEDVFPENESDESSDAHESAEGQKEKPRRATLKELFEEAYEEALSLKKGQRKVYIMQKMMPYFRTEMFAKTFVEKHLERKQRNLVERRKRLTRKLRLQDFNYFCTFTYDDAKHTEDSFKRGLKSTLSRFSSRKGWKYAGVWERSPEKKRLHFLK